MPWVQIRLYADLAELAGEVEVAVPIGASRSVKDAVESRGDPIPRWLVDSQPVDLDHRLYGGERVAVFARSPASSCRGTPRWNRRRWLLDSSSTSTSERWPVNCGYSVSTAGIAPTSMTISSPRWRWPRNGSC